MKNVKRTVIYDKIMGSDHCPIYMRIVNTELNTEKVVPVELLTHDYVIQCEIMDTDEPVTSSPRVEHHDSIKTTRVNELADQKMSNPNTKISNSNEEKTPDSNARSSDKIDNSMDEEEERRLFEFMNMAEA